MAERALDRARFAKCRALMDRGVTAGERAAGEAAARRVAAAAGLSLAEALRLAGAPEVPRRPGADRPSRRRPPPWETPPLRADPITVDEILAQKAANLARLKRKAAREAKRLREVYARQEAEAAVLRDEQAARDRAWTASRSPGEPS